jgi:hypothetical protein
MAAEEIRLGSGNEFLLRDVAGILVAERWQSSEGRSERINGLFEHRYKGLRAEGVNGGVKVLLLGQWLGVAAQETDMAYIIEELDANPTLDETGLTKLIDDRERFDSIARAKNPKAAADYIAHMAGLYEFVATSRERVTSHHNYGIVLQALAAGAAYEHTELRTPERLVSLVEHHLIER